MAESIHVLWYLKLILALSIVRLIIECQMIVWHRCCRQLRRHNAVWELSKIVPRQCHTKFDNKDVQSTILTILVENQILMLSGKWSKYGPKNGAYFIKVAYRRYHFRETFVSGKVFATMHLRKKLVSNFRNPDSDYIISRFLKIF